MDNKNAVANWLEDHRATSTLTKRSGPETTSAYCARDRCRGTRRHVKQSDGTWRCTGCGATKEAR